MLSNKNLKFVYDSVYSGGAYEKFFTFNSFFIFNAIVNEIKDWRNLTVLDVGSGEGDLAALLSIAGAERVDSIDYSEEAIEISNKKYNIDNVHFYHQDAYDCEIEADVIVMAGVLEHIDLPYDLLDKLITKNLKDGGILITASPSFVNVRGIVWMTLQCLYDVPMSLTDQHFFSPVDFEKYAKDNEINCSVKTIDKDWGGG